jgi:hypothetical protein
LRIINIIGIVGLNHLRSPGCSLFQRIKSKQEKGIPRPVEAGLGMTLSFGGLRGMRRRFASANLLLIPYYNLDYCHSE